MVKRKTSKKENKKETTSKLDIERIKEEIRELREKYNLSEEDLKEIINKIEGKKEEIEEYIRNNPMKSTAIALVIGILLGKILKK